MAWFFAIFAALLDAQSANSAPCRPRKVLKDRPKPVASETGSSVVNRLQSPRFKWTRFQRRQTDAAPATVSEFCGKCCHLAKPGDRPGVVMNRLVSRRAMLTAEVFNCCSAFSSRAANTLLDVCCEE
jgi:hypothetical protein